MTPEEFRRIALSMDGAIEGAHMGHPDFRANGKIFATLYPDGQWGMVKLTPDQQQEFMLADSATFVPASAPGDARDARPCVWLRSMKTRLDKR